MPVRLNPQAAQAWGLALSFGWRVAAGVVLGYWLDRWFDTTPVLIAVFAVGGLVGAVADLLRLSRRQAADRQSGRSDDGQP